MGLETEVGYLGDNGSGRTPLNVAYGDTKAKTESDLFVTARAKVGFVALNKYRVYGSGGYIGASTTTSVVDNCNTSGCGGGLVDAKKDAFRNGWTVGGGFEAPVWNNWSIRGDYLYYNLGVEQESSPTRYQFDTLNTGNILRFGVNYRFEPGSLFGL